MVARPATPKLGALPEDRNYAPDPCCYDACLTALECPLATCLAELRSEARSVAKRERQARVKTLVAAGKGLEEIAAELGVSPRTLLRDLKALR